MTKATPDKPKVAVIREELVRLTGHYIAAMALNQLLYWTEHRRDFQPFMQEEIANAMTADDPPQAGWIFKTAEELADELMIGCGASTMRKYLSILVRGGWVVERHNPNRPYDRTLQYRVDTRKIQQDLMALGYVLDGYPLYDSLEMEPDLISEDAFSNDENPFPKNENGTIKNCETIPENPLETPEEITTETPPPKPPSRGASPRPLEDFPHTRDGLLAAGHTDPPLWEQPEPMTLHPPPPSRWQRNPRQGGKRQRGVDPAYLRALDQQAQASDWDEIEH